MTTTLESPATAAWDDAIASGKTYGDMAVQHALFRDIRDQDPVHWTQPEGFRPFWTITKNADILTIEKRTDIFVSAKRSKLWSIDFERQVAEIMQGSPNLVRGLPQMDGEEHKKYRQLTQAWFQPRQVKQLEERIRQLARDTVSDLLKRSEAGPFDFYNEIAVWYPLRVILLILGLPDSDAPRLCELSMSFFGGADPEMQKGRDLIAATRNLIDYFDGVSEDRRRQPKDDVATLIANSVIDGQPIGHHEASSYYIALATAGHDTTSSTAAGGILAFTQNPIEWRKLKDNRALVGSAIDEMVRWVSPVKHFMRTATEDHELRGKLIRAGDSVLLSYPSGNRDEETFGDPFTFRVDRSPNRHVGFGFGAHACLGMFLAKFELQILFEEILERVESFELAGEPAWVQTAFVGGLKRLPVKARAA